MIHSPMGSLLLSPGSWCEHYFVCALQEWSLCFFQSCQSRAKSFPTSLRSLILWEFPLLLLDPQVGKPDVGLRTFTPVGGHLWYNCSPICESPTQWLWDLILLWLCPSYHLTVASPLSLDVAYLFWWVPVSSSQWLFSSSISYNLISIKFTHFKWCTIIISI